MVYQIDLKNTAPPWTRVVILLASLACLCLLSWVFTGSALPRGAGEVAIFQNALLLIVLGSALLEAKFTKPGDSAVNGLMGMVTLVTIYGLAPRWGWFLVFGYCAAVFLLASLCVAVSSGEHIIGWRKAVADHTYRPSVVLGKARLLYSIVFLFSLFSFYEVRSIQTVSLVLFWGIFMAIWPLGLPGLLSGLVAKSRTAEAAGRVIRTDWPNLVRVALAPKAAWSYGSAKILKQSDGKQRLVMALFSQAQEDRVLGTGLCVADINDEMPNLDPGWVYEAPPKYRISSGEVAPLAGGDESSTLIGFVVEGSTIGKIRFETWDYTLCREGMLVWCRLEERVFYQVTEGLTREEDLEHDHHGYQVAEAAQVGRWNASRGFEKYPWLPPMNTPVFAEPGTFGNDVHKVHDTDFEYGHVPGTQLAVYGPFADMLEYHTAILGVTGSGKTELAFDLIRHAVGNGTKVICIDLTARYQGRLDDLNPTNLSLSGELTARLGEKLFEVETGQYSAGAEKKALREFAASLESEIKSRIESFIVGDDTNLGILTLDEISNTKATLHITEMYLTRTLHYAREHPTCPRVLIVVEEAHTVMPETSTMGLGDFDSKGLVAKIAQIALQGRKYGVGLLIVAQRTATVSKTVLTQCNTIVAFSCFDETSLGFLENVFGREHARALPNLQFLQAVVFGKGVRSQRPLIVEIPFKQEKADSSKRTPKE